ncbi:MAG: DISARM system SNF2-like helicase DrmD [Thermoguttaceae bacterium]|nr:DISARM system SNF2-like helicase DrmD [Thermoguttaceae bacterium]
MIQGDLEPFSQETSISENNPEEIQQIPECGQLVRVRSRRWCVADVISSQLSHRLDKIQYRVILESIEEDALGERLEILWNLEPGACVLEEVRLPDILGFDSNPKLSAFLDAVRWGAATNTNLNKLQAPFRSGITIEDYQLDPLVRAIGMSRANLLIADDVGLGKTIEAGLVIEEFILRHRVQTVLVVCPATLQIKWQTEMLEKFGLEFRIVDTEYLRDMRRKQGLHINPWTSFPRLITSMDWIKSGDGLRYLKDILPSETYPRKFDMLVVDEAHNVAPAAAAQYALPSQRTRIIKRLVPHFTHHLFLTATPHNGYAESFTSLLELLDDQRFAKNVMPDPKQLNHVMVRRLKDSILDENQKPRFPKRVLKGLEIEYTPDEQKVHQLLREFTALRLKSVENSRFANGTKFVHILLKKRLFSSPAAFAHTLEKHRETLLHGRSKPKSSTDTEERILHQAILRLEDDSNDENEMEMATDEAVNLATELAPSLDPKEEELLGKLSQWAERNKDRADSKAKAILNWLNSHLKTDGKWNDKRVVLFTEYLDTHKWLQTILAHHGFGGDRLAILTGGMTPEEREKVKNAFQTTQKSEVRILLATDAASEGIDLQNCCNYMIHIEIPWNPNVMEQRNGRIDRHGQREPEVYIWHPVGKGFSGVETEGRKPGDIEGDCEYLMRAALKINNIRRDLGSVGPVIAQQIEEAMLGHRKTLDTSDAETKRNRAATMLAEDKKLGQKIERLHSQLLETKEDFHLTPDHILNAVQTALELAGKPPLRPVSLPGLPDGTAFEVPPLDHSWGDALKGLAHPHTGVRRPITFDYTAVKDREDVVLAHLNHRLVQMSLRLLREQIWQMNDKKGLYRVAVQSVPGLTTPVALVWSRLVITGGDHHRLHEELIVSGGELKTSSFRRISTQTELDSLLKAAVPFDSIAPEKFELLKTRFEMNREAILKSIDARSEDRMENLKSTIRNREEKEIEDITEILDHLAASIQAELEKTPAPDDQLKFEFYTEAERTQIHQDRRELEARLERIPEEKEAEIRNIHEHYRDLQSRVFPAAVVFLVPQDKAWGAK